MHALISCAVPSKLRLPAPFLGQESMRARHGSGFSRRIECRGARSAAQRSPPPPPPGGWHDKERERDPVLERIKEEIHPIEERMIQWFPGHIAKAERDLKEQLRAVDIIFEVRDGRIPMSTRHPHVPKWAGNKPRLLLLNRRDMITEADRQAWTDFFVSRGRKVMWTDGNKGDGVTRVVKEALAVSAAMNEKRQRRGLRPRPVRAVVIGFPNVGKSALINRLLGRRMADSAPRPGVTRVLKWMRIGGDLDLLDAPGIIPMSFRDQVAAQRLAMCNDIGEASYVDSLVAAALLRTLRRLPEGEEVMRRVQERYKVSLEGLSPEEYVHAVGDRLFNSEAERAGQRILKDYRTLALGHICLERPEQYAHFTEV